MVLTIAPINKTIRKGTRAIIQWSTLRAKKCLIFGEGLAVEGESGEEETDRLYDTGSYTYTLECENGAGVVRTARTSVIVK
jgi:hypothetical protein